MTETADGYREYSLEEAADIIGMSASWLVKLCRAEQVDHIAYGDGQRKIRRFNDDHIAAIRKKYEVKPEPSPRDKSSLRAETRRRSA